MDLTPEQQERLDLEQIKQGRSHLVPRPIGSIMRRLLNENGYAAIATRQALLDVWREILGESLASCARPGKVWRGKLLIEVSSSQALQEIHFRKDAILKALQAALPSYKIKGLSFKVFDF
jgi:hypothetical protein